MSTQIHDLGYRAYEGERAGVPWAMFSLFKHAARRVFGLKRPARYKALPIITVLLAIVPAIVFVGMAALLGDQVISDALIPTYGEYFGFISGALTLFAGLVAPDVLSTDRRSGMLALYLASPLNRTTYIVSKAASVFVIMMVLTLLPMLFLIIAFTLAGSGPGGFVDFIVAILRAIGLGVLTAAFYTGISLLISSFSKRRGIASVAIIIGLLAPSVVSNIILEATDISDNIGLISVNGLPIEAAVRIFGEEMSFNRGLGQVDTLPVLAVPILIAAVTLALTWWRYQEIDVDR